MNISTFLTLYAISIPIFIVLDLLWLGVVAKDFYQVRLGHLLGDVNWAAAIVFYAVFLAGVTFFATYPSASGTVFRAILLGALFGFVTYATYDLTNNATLRDWPVIVTVVDIIWGTALGATVAGLTHTIYKLIS